MTPLSDVHVKVVVDGFETVRNWRVSRSVVTEVRPVVQASQHLVCVVFGALERAIQLLGNMLVRGIVVCADHSRLEALHRVGSGRVSNGGAKGSDVGWEVAGDGVELVVVQRVCHGLSSSIRERDRDSFVGDDLVRRERLAGPVPVRSSEVHGDLRPLGGVLRVCLCNLDCFLLNQLLNRTVRTHRYIEHNGLYFVYSDVGPVPGWEEHDSMGTVSGPTSLVLRTRAVPWLVRETVNATNLEERQKCVLIRGRDIL